MKKRFLSLALTVALLLGMTAVFTPIVALADILDVVAGDIVWNGGGMSVSWPAVAGASSYKIEHGGARINTTWRLIDAAYTGTSYTDNSPNPNKYENYYRITPNNGSQPILISLEGKIFGPNCYFFDAKYHTGTMAVREANDINMIPAGKGADHPPGKLGMMYAEMSPLRFALFFKPGEYDDNHARLWLGIGYYTSAYGLGKLPTETQVGAVWCWPCVGSADGGANVTQVFWRSIENLQVTWALANPDSLGDGFRWSASQAVSARRMNVLAAATFDWDYGWASGGYVADSVFHRRSGTVSGQQYYYRNNQFASAPEGCSWHTFFAGCVGGRPDNFMGTNHATNFATVEKIREKPFIYLDGDEYKVFVPTWRENASGVTWGAGKANGGMGEGYSLDLLSSFYIAKPDIDTAETINDALDGGMNLILTPGIYNLDVPLHVSQENAIVLGLGLATLQPTANNKWGCMLVEDVDGVVITGILFESRFNTVYLLRVGEEDRVGDNHQANPVFLQDLFFRIGPGNCFVQAACQILSNDVITDHFWIWRADHGGATGWTVNVCEYGLWVAGDRVTTNALFNEHHNKYSTYWEGEYGKLYFYQNETPYDPGQPQSNYMSHKGTVNGYAQLKVANKVENFYCSGGGIYSCVFANALNGGTHGINGIEVPIKPGVIIEHMMHQNLAGGNSTRYLINNAWPTNNGNIYMERYNGAGTYPVDDADDPDFVMPNYEETGIEEPFPQGEMSAITYDLTDLTKAAGKGKVLIGDTLYITLTRPSFGYYVPASVTVTKTDGGAAVPFTYTPSADRFSATIVVPNVVDDLTVTAAGVYDAYSITCNLGNIATNAPALAYSGTALNATLTAAAGYILPDKAAVTVTMGGVAVPFTYNLSPTKQSAAIKLDAVTGPVVITAAGIYMARSITYNLTRLTKAGNSPDIAYLGDPVGITLIAAGGGCAVPDAVEIVMDDVILTAGVDYSYVKSGTTAALITVFEVTGDIIVNAVGAGAGGLPTNNGVIYLIALRNGKIVRCADAMADGTMVADVDILPANLQYIQLTVVNNADFNFLRATNNNTVTLESDTYGGEAVRPRTPGMGLAGWESTILVPQDDGTIKITRPTTGGDSVGVGSTRYVDVEDNGNLKSVVGDPGDTAKFMWFYASIPVVIPVDKAPLEAALNLFGSLTEADWTAESWADAAAAALAGQGVYDDSAATQEGVDAATAALLAAINALEPVEEPDVPDPLPKAGDLIVLRAVNYNNYIVGADQASFITYPGEIGRDARATMSARAALTTSSDLAIFEVVSNPDDPEAFFLKARNGLFVSIEGASYGGTAVRPRTQPPGVWDGWEGIKFFPQEDGGVKIARQFARTGTRWVSYNASGALVAQDAEPALSSGLFTWEKVGDTSYAATLSESDIYTFLDEDPLTVTVANTGFSATGQLSVALSGANADAFVLSDVLQEITLSTTGDTYNDLLRAGLLAAGVPYSAAKATTGTATFKVAPVAGLEPGTYTATVTVSNLIGNIAEAFDVTFTVKSDEPPYIKLADGQAMSIKLAVGAQVTLDIDSNLDDLVFSCPTTYVIVDQNGVVTGIKGGMAVITVTSAGNPALKANVVVTVS